MSLELIYTSVPRGLGPGSSGFCTAAATGGMSRQVTAKLEALSGYQFHFNLSDPKAAENPVNWAHTQVRSGADTLSVLSRIAFSGADYSGRTNKIAHHFLLEQGEGSANGPAWMLMTMAQHQAFVAGYSGDPRSLPKRDLRAVVPQEPRPPEPATTWQSMTGDAGWAGMLAKAFRENPKTPAFVIFAPGQQLLPLFEEAIALLPPEERWQVGFATYYTALPAGCQYHWRGIIAGSSAAKEIQRFPGAAVIDLTTALGRAPDNMFTQAARTGTVLPPVRAPERPRIQIVDRAPHAVPVAAAVTREAEVLPWAMESGTQGPRIAPEELVPSPEQLKDLRRRARRARLVAPLAAAVILLAITTLFSTALLFHNPLGSGPRSGEAVPSPASVQPDEGGPVTPSTPPTKQQIDGPAPKEAAPAGGGKTVPSAETREELEVELTALVAAVEDVEKEARDAASNAGAACDAARETSDILDQVPKQINAENLAGARQDVGDAEDNAQRARDAANESKKNSDQTKKKYDAVVKQTEKLTQRAKDDTNFKTAIQAAKTRAIQATKDAEKSSADAASKAAAAEKALTGARTGLSAAEARVIAEQDKAPKIVVVAEKRDDPWAGAHPEWAKAPCKDQKLKPDSEDGHRKFFSLKCGDRLAFLPLPEAQIPSLKASRNAAGVALQPAASVGSIAPALVTCTFRPGPQLFCDTSGLGKEGVPEDYRAFKQWLVVELADLDSKHIYQCALSSDGRISEKISARYNAAEKQVALKSVKFKYPWPDSLKIVVGSHEVRMNKAGCAPSFAIKGQNFNTQLDLAISKQSDNYYDITISMKTLMEAISNLVSPARDSWTDAKRSLETTQGEIDNLRDRQGDEYKRKMATRKSQEDTLKQIEKPVFDLLDNARRAFFDQTNKIQIIDAWGLPVVDLTIEFTGDAKAIFEASSRR